VAVPITSIIVEKFGWDAVFYVLAIELFVAAMLYHSFAIAGIAVIGGRGVPPVVRAAS
jgi:sugar phosphate permease